MAIDEARPELLVGQEVGLGLGAQVAEARPRDVFSGFGRFQRAAATLLNLIPEARA